MKNYPKALKFYKKSLKIKYQVRAQESIESADTLQNIGDILEEMGNYVSALEYYRKCLSIKEKIRG